jgi:hypothetical protein
MVTASVSPVERAYINKSAQRAEGIHVAKAEEPANAQAQASRVLTDHFRCPEEFAALTVRESHAATPGYFRFGNDAICYGQCSSGRPATTVNEPLHDALQDVEINGSTVLLPFDPAQIVNNLRHERYHSEHALGRTANRSSSLIRKLYYLARPLLSVALRKHLQRIYLGDWEKIPFPHWPVDFSVEDIHEQLLALSMKSRNFTKIPFIWFWPKGALSCTAVTHDVESVPGWDFCPQLMDLDDSFGIKSSFQVIPEERYTVTQERLDAMKERGFELNVHDLNHDGNLMTDRNEFMRRAPEINRHGKAFGALGFRSAVLYRNIDWHNALDFSYDMSIPNVAHLDPQRGGCCTVFPFFNGSILELPVTMSQDYSLFNILKDYSIDLWKKQISLIRQRHGLMQMIVHPDYIMEEPARRVYAELLGHLADLRDRGETWIALPAEIDKWWRLRNELRLVNDGSSWQVTGKGAEKAQIAYACLLDGKLTYELDPVA